MFALEVEYLTRRAASTDRSDREHAEWPPHPGRLFSALVAACHEGDLTNQERDAARDALRWLEQQPPPALAVSEADARDVNTVYIPINYNTDQIKLGAKGKVTMFPPINGEIGLRRDRQPRTFPSVTPQCPSAYFIWREADPTAVNRHNKAMVRLAECMTYLGHSSSLVRVAVCADAQAIQVTHEPADTGSHALRIPVAGRLDELEQTFARGARPSAGIYKTYQEVDSAPVSAPEAASAFGDLVVAQLDGSFLPLTGALRLTAVVRQALIKATDEADSIVKSLVSGHADSGEQIRDDHLAYVPLANVGHRFGDGRVAGFALVLPRTLGRFSNPRRAILRALAHLDRVRFGEEHSWRVSIPGAGEGPRSLLSWPYLGPSRTWASVTPVLCDRFPKDRDGHRVEDVIRESCQRVLGLEPVRILVHKVSWVRGVPPAQLFTHTRRSEEVPRHRTHVLVEFDRCVRGPVILGAGRYLGLGLCRVLLRREGAYD